MPIPRSDDGPILDTGSPELLVDLPAHTGEGPLWHEDEKVLYWLDIPVGRVYRYDPVDGSNEIAFEHEAPVGGFTIQDDGALLLFAAGGTILEWRDGHVRAVVDDVPAEHDSRFNDVIADPAGRVFCGTMPSDSHPGRLYRLDIDGSLTLLFNDIGLSNGLGFTADERVLFHTDTNFRAIYRLDYDRQSGSVGNRQPIVRTPADRGVPDGMAVDMDDTIWSARWGGAGIFRYTTNGKLIGRVPMPVRNVSSITFGGPDYRTAFVTTACAGEARSEHIGQLAGSLFAIDLGVRGKPPYRSRIHGS